MQAATLGGNIAGEQLLDLDRVMPIVAEVVEVGEGGAGLAVEVAQAHLALVEHARIVLEGAVLQKLRIAVAQAADAELVQVGVPPVEGCLDAQVKLPEVPGPGHDEAAPDRRLDLGQRDPDLQGVGLLVELGPKWTRPARRRQLGAARRRLARRRAPRSRAVRTATCGSP